MGGTRKGPTVTGGGVDKFRAAAGTGGVAAVIAIILFLANIQTQLNRNCAATKNVGTVVAGVVATDNELARPNNADFRRTLILSLHGISCGGHDKNNLANRVEP